MVVPVTPVQNLGICDEYLSDIVDYIVLIENLDNIFSTNKKINTTTMSRQKDKLRVLVAGGWSSGDLASAEV